MNKVIPFLILGFAAETCRLSLSSSICKCATRIPVRRMDFDEVGGVNGYIHTPPASQAARLVECGMISDKKRRVQIQYILIFSIGAFVPIICTCHYRAYVNVSADHILLVCTYVLVHTRAAQSHQI